MILSIDTFLKMAETSPALYITALVALFEIYVRLRPTKKNLSILDKLHTLINVVIPNYKFEDGVKNAGKIIKDKFKVK